MRCLNHLFINKNNLIFCLIFFCCSALTTSPDTDNDSEPLEPLDFSKLTFETGTSDSYSLFLFSEDRLEKSKEVNSHCPECIRPYLRETIKKEVVGFYKRGDKKPKTENNQKIIEFQTMTTKDSKDKEFDYIVVVLSKISTVPSAKFLEKLLKVNSSDVVSSSWLLIFPQTPKEAIICTFGQAHQSLLNPLGVVHNWGRNITASKHFCDPEKVREISAKQHKDTIPSQRSERSADFVSIEKFGLEVGSEEIIKFRGQAQSQYESSTLFHGQDFFIFRVSQKCYQKGGDTLRSLRDISHYLYKYSKDKQFSIHPKLRKYIDEEVTDTDIKARLNKTLCERILKKNENCLVFLHDYVFRMVGKNIRFGPDNNFFHTFIKKLTKPLTIASDIIVSQSTKGGIQESQTLPLSCLIYSLPIADPVDKTKFYRFDRGSWFHVASTRFEAIKDALRKHKVPKEGLGLPGYTLRDTLGETRQDYKEIVYNTRAVERLNKKTTGGSHPKMPRAFLIDRHNISLGKGGDKFEFGDILLKTDDSFYVIHVKRAGANSLSHHREQVERSACYLADNLLKKKERLYPFVTQEIDDYYEKHKDKIKERKHKFQKKNIKRILDSKSKFQLGSSKKKDNKCKITFDFKRFLQEKLQDKKINQFFKNHIPALQMTVNTLYDAVINKVITLAHEQGQSTIDQNGPTTTNHIAALLTKIYAAAQEDEIVFAFFTDGILSAEIRKNIIFVLAVLDDRKIDQKRKMVKPPHQDVDPKISDHKKRKNEQVKITYKMELDTEDLCLKGKKSPLFHNQDLWGLDYTRRIVQTKGFQFQICITNEECDVNWDAFGAKNNKQKTILDFFKPGTPDAPSSSEDERDTEDSLPLPEDMETDDVSSPVSPAYFEDDTGREDTSHPNKPKAKELSDENVEQTGLSETIKEASQAVRFEDQTYWIVPTCGGGDCFFHAILTEDNSDKTTIIEAAAHYRQEFFKKIENGDYHPDLKNLVYEYYLRLWSDKNFTDIPNNIKILLQENEDYEFALNIIKKAGVDLTQEQLTKLRIIDIKELITHEQIQDFLKPLQKVGGSETYIPFRPNMVCPAERLAKLMGVRIRIFTLNSETNTLQLAKKESDDNSHPIINILHAGDHYRRLYQETDNPEATKDCRQILLNYQRFRKDY